MKRDAFTKGMDAWSQEDDEVLDTYRLWQMKLIAPYLGSSTVEIGAGNGRFARALLARRSFERYVALEPSSHFYEGLRQLQGAETRQATVDAYAEDPEHHGRFDSVFSIHVLEHIEDDRGFVEMAWRLLRPGGRLITLVPALDFLYSRLDERIGHFRRYDRRKAAALAAHVGGEVEVNRYDNLIGVVGYWYVCKLRGIDYHTKYNKDALKGWFQFFSRYMLPAVSRLESVLPPPVGLNLTAVFRKSGG